MTILVFLGKPGSGKGSIAFRVSKILRLQVFSVGELLRLESAKNTVLGNRIRKRINLGFLALESDTETVLAKSIAGKQSFILDGFPRTLRQAKWLDSALSKKKWVVSAAIELNISDAVCIQRIEKRMQCSRCGAHTLDKNGFRSCDKCGGALVRRDDDQPKAIRKRLQLFRKKTFPALQYYKKLGLLVEIDASQPIPIVVEDLLRSLKNRQSEFTVQ